MPESVKGMGTCRFAVQFMVAYRIPAGLFLLDQVDAASDYLKTELAKLGDNKDPASLRFRTFAANLAKRIDLPTQALTGRPQELIRDWWTFRSK